MQKLEQQIKQIMNLLLNILKTTGVDIELQVNNEEDILNLNKLSYKELRFYCKRNNITYTGKHKTKIA